jgi:ABC-type Fe3+-hydroxamate transport system substrate-binding protein
MPPLFVDQLNNEIQIDSVPKRIVSLVPSQTELLHDLGLGQEVVGITRFCIHPSTWRTTKAIIGGTKNFNFDAIDRLQPDLIIGNKEENYEQGIEQLRSKYPVWMSDIVTLNDSYSMIHSLGRVTGKTARATELIENISQGFSQSNLFNGEKVLYLIWREPWMAAGKGTFIDSVMKAVGFSNVVEKERYPELDLMILSTQRPTFVFLSSEPYPFRDKHIAEVQQLFPTSKVVLVDGEMFSWYGSRLVHAPTYFQSLHTQLKSDTL